MKKLFSLFLSLFLSLSINAQIQTNFLGLTLGESTRSNVIAMLHYNYSDHKIFNEENGEILVDNVKFGGIKWQCVQLDFVNDKLYAVVFSSDNSFADYNTLCNDFESVKEGLAKYSMYKVDELFTDFSVGYNDSATEVFLYLHPYNEESFNLTLMYLDQNLLNTKNQQEKDEF